MSTIEEKWNFVSWFGKAAVAVGAVLGAAAVWHWWWKRNHHEYTLVGRVSRVFIYPVKSCKGIPLPEAECSKLGFVSTKMRDREFLIVKSNGHFITARQEPSMLLIAPSIHEEQLWLDAPGMTTLKITKPIKNTSRNSGDNQTTKEVGAPLAVTIWGENMVGLNCGEEASRWLSTYIGKPGIQLVYFPEAKSPRVPEMYTKWDRFKKTDNSIFADLTSYMLLSEASVEDLNTRLEKKITINNFRPSIAVEGCQPYDEESWTFLKIGDISFRNVKPCTRCVLTTIDPETGVKDGIEPLRTLKSYKKLQKPEHQKLEGESPVFGSHLSADSYGQIKVGDPVYAVIGKTI